MEIHIKEIAAVVCGKTIQYGQDFVVNEFLTDSRLLLFPSRTLFFAIRTSHNDGHYFIEDLYDKGVRAFIISDAQFPAEEFPEASFILVPDTVNALQSLAAYHRSLLTAKVIAITGSNGKTIVKEWLKQILETRFRTVASPKSYNSQIGVPLSVLQAGESHEIAIFEAGISEPGEMVKLERIIQPEIGLITNIGEAHGENFPSLSNKLFEKLILFRNAQVIIFNSEQHEVAEAVRQFAEVHKIALFSWGKLSFDNLRVEIKRQQQDYTTIQLYYKEEAEVAELPFADAASIENALHAIATALYGGLSLKDVVAPIGHLKPVALRLELQKGINNSAIINDSYNLDFDSLKSALDFLQHQQGFSGKTLILSDVLQSDKPGQMLYRDIGKLIREKNISRFIGVGEKISSYRSFFPEGSLFFKDTPHIIEHIQDIGFRDEVILLKGARSFHFEDISHALQQHTHETILEVDLNAIAHNFKHFRSKVYPAGIMAMVKASAYGNGSEEIAGILQFHGVNYLVVAYADEGVALRKAGITVPIMVMNPENESFDDIITYNLEPEIYNFRTLDLLEQYAGKNLFYQSRIIRFHIKLDTGMHRLGFMEQEMECLIDRLSQLKNSRVQSVFSHFAGSDDAAMDSFTTQQIERFARMSETIMSALPYKVFRHINNSSAIHRFPKSQFDMVRLGIGLYGVSTSPEEQKLLLPVSRLFTTISQIKTIPAGDYVGYNQGFRAERATTIAILPIGYADGLLRSLKNRGKVWVNGTLCPMVGNICMDMCMVDISGVDAKEGDRVELFGEHQPVRDFAEQAGTIAYEVLTSISPRVKRIYTQE